jgi:hypothetical protein
MVVQLSLATCVQSQLTDAVERDEVTDALRSICREEKWGRFPRRKNSRAASSPPARCMKNDSEHAILDTHHPALGSAVRPAVASCMTCALLKHSLRASRDQSLAPAWLRTQNHTVRAERRRFQRWLSLLTSSFAKSTGLLNIAVAQVRQTWLIPSK